MRPILNGLVVATIFAGTIWCSILAGYLISHRTSQRIQANLYASQANISELLIRKLKGHELDAATNILQQQVELHRLMEDQSIKALSVDYFDLIAHPVDALALLRYEGAVDCSSQVGEAAEKVPQCP